MWLLGHSVQDFTVHLSINGLGVRKCGVGGLLVPQHVEEKCSRDQSRDQHDGVGLSHGLVEVGILVVGVIHELLDRMTNRLKPILWVVGISVQFGQIKPKDAEAELRLARFE